MVVAGAVGISGNIWSTTPLPDDIKAEDFSIFAGVLPEDKYRLVKALQASGHIVGMCGDGANDAPALRQAQMGIAVSTATGIVLTARPTLTAGMQRAATACASREGWWNCVY